MLLESVWRRHDREQYDWYVYDATVFRDAQSVRLRTLMPNWRDIYRDETDAAVQLILDDRIDILIDLAGHTAGNCLKIFARKPAPVSASWLGYPGSTGIPAIDYLISDEYTSPTTADQYMSEQVIRLPHTRFCYDPLPSSPNPALPRPGSRFTFGCFNNIAKINPEVLALWANLFDAVPDARMIIKSAALDDVSGRDLLLADWAAAGIDPARLELRGWSSYADTLRQYGDLHAALDPFPFCGGLTSMDALWMGVPVVTLEGTLMAGRQTFSFLRNIGHAELAAQTPAGYVEIATRLARQPVILAQYRKNLRAAMSHSPLLGHADLTRHLEQSYRTIWRHWCEKTASVDAATH